MQIEEYFEFISPDEIKVRGHRVWIEDILYEYIHREMTPKQLLQRFPTLDEERVYATLLYYHQHQDEMDRYIANWLAFGVQMRVAQSQKPTALMQRVKEARSEQRQQADELMAAN